MISSRWISPPATWKAKNPSSHSTSNTPNSVINIEISCVSSVLPPIKLDGNLFAPSAPLRRLKRRGQRRESGASRRGGSNQLDHHLADVSPLEQADEGIHRAVDSFRDRFPVLQLARFEITAHFLLEFGLTVQPITDDKALHGEPFRGDVKQIERAGARLCFVVAGDAATGDDPAMHTQCRERSVEGVASDIIEIHIDATGGLQIQLFEHRTGFELKAPSNPHSSRRNRTFSAEPAEPTTRHRRNFASCPATLPTAPAAPEMKMTSPDLTSTKFSPAHAVMPVIPRAPR